MKQLIRVVRQPAALTLALLLTACGGGGGGSGGGSNTPAPTPPPAPTPAPPPPAAPGCNITIAADAMVLAGKTAGAAALSGCPAPIASVLWTKVSGPAIAMQATRNPTVSVETSEAGTVVLQAEATLTDGRISTATTNIVIAPAPVGSYITVRADHSLRVGTETSVRAWPVLANGERVTKIEWTRLDSGPAVTMDTRDPNVMFFRAPTEAAVDTALKFRATMTTSGGRVDSDDVIVSIDRQTAKPNHYIFDQSARVHPYVAGGAYTGVLARCTYDVSLFYNNNTGATNLCNASTLPLLATEVGENAVPSVAQVMSRVLVSHDFLGKNFEAFLTNQDANGDFRRMLGSVTSIVIGSHVRPSFYQPHTGAIYLDADYLWLNANQRDVVTEVPDFRIAFAEQLNFTGVGRQIINNNYARDSYSPTERVVRPEGQLLYGLGRLMYHELAHAADFFAPGSRSLDMNKSILMNVAPRITAKSLPSDFLAINFPLRSAEMRGLGQVLYQGATPDSTQKAYTAADVGSFFGSDVASDDYAYSLFIDDNKVPSNSREDLAMLFEEFMMSYRHGVKYDVGYTNRYVEGMTSDQLIVAWGQRGRIGTPAIKERLKSVVTRIAPWIGTAPVDALPAPIQLKAGVSWENNLNPSALPQAARFNFSGVAEKTNRAREDVAGRKHAH